MDAGQWRVGLGCTLLEGETVHSSPRDVGTQTSSLCLSHFCSLGSQSSQQRLPGPGLPLFASTGLWL